jgi:hypothetical protein
MGLTMKDRRKITKEVAGRYQRAFKKGKGKILDEFVQLTEYNFTRSRPHRKNDNCFVEQKNYSVVRRAVGYLRYTTEQEQAVINNLYGHLRLYTNFFQPVMKLREKIRSGSSVTKRYDRAKTPYQRILESPFVSPEVKNRIRSYYVRLNPADLNRKITKLQGILRNSALSNSFAVHLPGRDIKHNSYFPYRSRYSLKAKNLFRLYPVISCKIPIFWKSFKSLFAAGCVIDICCPTTLAFTIGLE